MGLVDYSESDSSGSEAEAPAKQIPKPKAGKKAFQPVMDKSNPGKIIVNLAGTATAAGPSDEPPAKRARTMGGGGGGRFAGFNSFLPAPKNTAAKQGPALGGGSKPSPGFGLRTSAAPGFSRDAAAVAPASASPSMAENHNNVDSATGEGEGPKSVAGGLLSLPPPKHAVSGSAGTLEERNDGPSIPEGQKPAAEVKLTGKPLMFRPLSVAKGKKKTSTAAKKPNPAQQPLTGVSSVSASAPAPAPEPLKKKKMSLFSIPTESSSTTPALGPSLSSGTGGAYEPLFETDTTNDYATAAYVAAESAGPAVEASIGDIANDMHLSAAARRDLFGRANGSSAQAAAAVAASRVVHFSTDREYQHNEALRASGEQQAAHNPVRSIQGGGKHSLRQLVSNVQGQKDALEDSFAQGRSNRREASSRYGW